MPNAKHDPAEVIRGLREQALNISAADLGVTPTTSLPNVFGVVMETGYPAAVATLVALADGTTSLYFSSGGGIIGAGEHAKVRTAATAFLSVAQQHLSKFAPTEQTPLPPVGAVRFYLRTFDGLRSADGGEQELGAGQHALSAVFYAAHDVIAAVRESSSAHSG